MNDEIVIERLRDAVDARTAHAQGRPDSLDALLLDLGATGVRRRRRVLVTATAMVAAAAAVVGVVVVATAVRGPLASRSPSDGISAGGSYRITAPSTERYPAADYFVTRQVTELSRAVFTTRPVLARTSDLAVVRALPISLMNATLTADGSRLYGWYAGAAGQSSTDNSASTNRRVNALVHRDSASHAVYLDFATGKVVQLGKAAFPGITGMTVTPDGRLVAYARIETKNGDHTIIRLLNVQTGKARELDVPTPHQVLALALSPDGRQLAFTETETTNILFLADLAKTDPVASAVPVSPPQPCRNGAYDFPTWNAQGLFAEKECEPDNRGMVAEVVRIDPQTTVPAGPALAPLPAGGADALVVLTTKDGLAFAYNPARGSGPGDQSDERVVFRNNELWVIPAGGRTGHRTGLVWSR